MNNLLNANIYKLKKDSIFKVFIIITIILSIALMYYWLKIDAGSTEISTTCELFGDFTIIIPFITAIFSSFFIGDDYQYGTVRNKIIAGNNRFKIYLSYLITIFLTTLFYYLIYICVLLLLGYSTYGFALTSNFIYTIISIIFLCLTYSAIYTFIAINTLDKSISLIINILITILMLFISIYGVNILNTPGYTTTYSMIDDKVIEIQVPNPNYPSKLEKKVSTFIVNTFPTGQSLEFFSKNTDNVKYYFLYSSILTIIITSLGIIIFKRKDLK